MKKAPAPTKTQGAAGQDELFDLPAFCPILPPANSATATALDALLEGSITQIDWLNRGHGWRLAADVKQLDYLGWCPESIRIRVSGRARPIALYSLPERAKQAAHAMSHGGGAAHASE